MDIGRVVHRSYSRAIKAMVMGTSAQALARARERAFVKCLIAEVGAVFSDVDIRVFSTYGRGNARDFGTEKLASDIAVARIDKGCAGGRDAAPFRYIARILWQIEIDFSRDWRRSVFAINRLNGSSAENKVLLAAQMSRGADDYLRTLSVPFAAGSGAAAIALIPHPAEWETTESAPVLWRLDDGDWIELT